MIRVGGVELDLLARTAMKARVAVNLSKREYALLEYLMQRPDRIVSKTEIAERAWAGEPDPGADLIPVYISLLRSKLGEGRYGLIRTVNRRGYMLRSDAPPSAGKVGAA